MKRFLILLICFSCSERIVVRRDFDKSVEIHRSSTYSWLEKKQMEDRNNPLVYNELNDKRVKQAVDEQLLAKGYQLKPEGSELIVHYHIVIDDKTAVYTDPYGYYYNNYWMMRRTDVYRYREGTLIIDFMDSRNCELIWRGWATSILQDDEVSEAKIREAVQKIFQQFPESAVREAATE